MFSRQQLFKVLHAFAHEEDEFLVAQDAYPALVECLRSLEMLETSIVAFEGRLEDSTMPMACSVRATMDTCLEQSNHMLHDRDLWMPLLVDLRELAQTFWITAPVDHTKVVGNDRSTIDQWRRLVSSAQAKERVSLESSKADQSDASSDTSRARGTGSSASSTTGDHSRSIREDPISEFRTRCAELVHSHLPDMAQQHAREEAEFTKHCETWKSTCFELYNSLSGNVTQLVATSQDMLIGACEPTISFNRFVSPHFARMLQFSMGRMFAVPSMQLVVNTQETQAVISALQEGTDSPGMVIACYRTAALKTVTVRWTIFAHPVSGSPIGIGVNVTELVRQARQLESAQSQAVLRQWLHSIRNASFQQQVHFMQSTAKDISEALVEERSSEHVRAKLDELMQSMNAFAHTVQVTVGMVDQSLENVGLERQMHLEDFVRSLSTFATNFALNDGIGDIPKHWTIQLDGLTVPDPSALRGLYGAGHVVRIRAILDILLSNAIRFTDPEQGVHVGIAVENHARALHVRITIGDHAPGGLPAEQVLALRRALGTQAVTVAEETSAHSPRAAAQENSVPTPVVNACDPNAAGTTGLQRAIVLHRELTSIMSRDEGENAQLRVATASDGSTFSLRFVLAKVVPSEYVVPQRPESSVPTGTVLVADDTRIVRMIIGKYLEKHGAKYQLAADGAEALSWFIDHEEECCGILTDLEMPNVGGLALIKEVRSRNTSVPIVIISGNNVPKDELPPGALDAFVKPVSADKIGQLLSTFCECACKSAATSNRPDAQRFFDGKPTAAPASATYSTTATIGAATTTIDTTTTNNASEAQQM